MPDTELLRLKKTCRDLNNASALNEDVTIYQKYYIRYLLETLKRNGKEASQLISQIKLPGRAAAAEKPRYSL